MVGWVLSRKEQKGLTFRHHQQISGGAPQYQWKGSQDEAVGPREMRSEGLSCRDWEGLARKGRSQESSLEGKRRQCYDGKELWCPAWEETHKPGLTGSLYWASAQASAWVQRRAGRTMQRSMWTLPASTSPCKVKWAHQGRAEERAQAQEGS